MADNGKQQDPLAQIMDELHNLANTPTSQTQIGVPKGYVPNVPSQYSQNTANAVGTPRPSLDAFTQQKGVGPDGNPLTTTGYQEGDQYAYAGADPSTITSIQKQLAATGLLKKGTILQQGVWDAPTQAAYKELLGYANTMGVSDIEALSRIQSGGGFGGVDADGNIIGMGGTSQPYQTNKDNIKAAVKALGPQVLGKEVPDDVVDEITNRLHAAEDKAVTGALGKEVAPSGDAAWYQEQLKELMPQTAQAFQQGNNLSTFQTLAGGGGGSLYHH